MKRPGKITISSMKSESCPEIRFSVHFWGHNEGSGGPCDNEEEVEKEVQSILNQHSKNYEIKIIDERIKQQTLFQ